MSILNEFNELFIEELKDVSFTRIALHKIDSEDAAPIRVKPRRFSPKENE